MDQLLIYVSHATRHWLLILQPFDPIQNHEEVPTAVKYSHDFEAECGPLVAKPMGVHFPKPT